jgi:hypothetical protein
MTTFVTTNSQVIDSVNYLLSNLDTNVASGNVTIPDGTLVANVTTGQITATGNVTGGANSFSYINQYVNLRYANNATGSSGFSTVPTNSNYFGVYNSNIATPSSNPAEYVWRQVSGGFGTTETIYYSSLGGRQVQFVAANSAPSSNFVVSVANVAIDLDVITTAAGLPGERGPIPMGYVITTADPTTASSSTLTGWFSAARDAVTPPIGTGLTPVTGDTAYFTYPTTGASATYEYNGSVWVSVIGQVVSGATLVANSVPGNSITASSITGDRISVNTIEGTNIAGDTITGNKIAANTITGTLIAANTIAGYNIIGDTITGNLIAANTIAGYNIIGNTITGNLIAANTITGNLIAANTITGNSIVANSITSTQISSAYIYAGNIVSFGASIGNTSSPGYWLQYNTGNARFGGNVSIGANLTVSGLITTGNLIANTVQTLTIVPSAVSAAAGVTSTANSVVSASNPAGTWTPLSGNAVVSVVNASQNVIISGGGELNASFTGTAGSPFYFNIRLRRYYNGDSTTQTLVTLKSPLYTPVASGTNYFQTIMPLPGYLDTIAANATTGLTYTYWFEVDWDGTASSVSIRSAYNATIAQALKR